LKLILKEDNPFYFCEHENLLTRISNHSTVHAARTAT